MTKKLPHFRIFKRQIATLGIVAGLILGGLLLFGLVVTVPFLNKVYPNIYVAGIYIGDKTQDEATQELTQKVKLPEKILLNLSGNKNEILVSEVVDKIDFTKTVERALNYPEKLKLIFKPVNLPLYLNLNEDRLLESLLIISEKAGTKPVYPSAKLVDGQIVIDKGTDGIEIDIDKLRTKIGEDLTYVKNSEIQVDLKEIKTALNSKEIEDFRNEANKLVGKKIELKLDYDTFTINDAELISFLTPKGFSDDLIMRRISEISKKLNRSPQDSVFVVENEKVIEFDPSEDGMTVDENLLLSQIKEMPSEITIPVIKVPPKIKNEDVNSLGIKTLLGRGFSNFKGSIPNRIFNVNHAQSKFKGVLIPPGEIVSFNQILGDVSALTGYKSAYVILAGKTVLGDGGGVCQVSTTLFRAVLDAGLPVIERRAHAYRVGYYEQGFGPGLDATVYSPTTDFKFKNDTPAHLLIQPEIDLTNLSLTFKIYGTSDGRVATTTKPVITSSTAPGEDVYQDDPTLKVGEVKQIEHRAYGARVVFDYNVTRNGETLIDQTFVSNYRPWQAVYLRGTMP